MPEGVGYGPQNTASIGKDIHVIGKHLYALSGTIAFDTSETTMIDTQTGNYYSKSFVQYGIPSATSGDITTHVYFNDVEIMGHETNDSATLDRRDALKLIIPPYTKVKITIQLSTGSTNGFCTITGRIYK